MKFMQNLALVLGILFLFYFLGVKISGGLWNEFLRDLAGYGTGLGWMGGMYEEGNSDSSYSDMDQKDVFPIGMPGMYFIRICRRTDSERVCCKGRSGPGLYYRAGGADESGWAEPCAADAAGYGL